jgi:UPF0102 protein DIP1513
MAHAKHNLLLGCRGEELAAQYFENLGAEIVGRNVRYHCGELDVVARFPDGEVVFVEVKTRSSLDYGGAEAVTPEKLTKLRRAAAMWLQGKPYMPVRFDVLVVLMNGDDVNYEHYAGVTDGAW